jgi:hypothetical protein
MHPKPIAETVMPVLPSERVFIMDRTSITGGRFVK